jgi:histidinol-phosphatase (PHP family)
VLAAGRFDRLLGSLHTLPDQGVFAEPCGIFPHRDPHDVVRDHLAEVAAMVSTGETFSVLAHIDYPVRFWPAEHAGPFDPPPSRTSSGMRCG